jgi:histone acetyltransferase
MVEAASYQQAPKQEMKQGEAGIGYSERDAGARKLEEQGSIFFRVYKNDKTLDSMKKLIELKTIISKQLPRMPKHYIVKLIMDRHHESLCLIKKEGPKETIIGGCVFRPFREQKFYEIAFLAIITNEQVKGYGTRLTNHLKDYA